MTSVTAPEEKEPEAVRNQEGQQAREAELDGELHREKRPRPQTQERATVLPQSRALRKRGGVLEETAMNVP